VTIGVGEILDKYELLEIVGQGGMAVVYRGFDRSLRREVAIKVLHSHLAESAEARDRFEREAHAVAKLRHKNILEIFDFSGNDSHESYIVTEFIDGPTLKQFITDHPIQYPELGALIATQVCAALDHAHSLGILHRDVKPENIMIGADGVVKLTDFGIAQMIDLQRMTVTGQLLGSPAYMSPEHVEGEPLDFRTDMFSVGILLYQLVTGELPFKGRNAHEILKRIADCTYPPARQLNPLVGNELDTIINTALAREKDDRYSDIGQMLAALQTYLEGSGMGDPREELEQLFAAPSTYQMALRERMLDHLARRGRSLMEQGSSSSRVQALELFNRVLTIDPDNEPVLSAIDRISRRRAGTNIALLVGGVIALVALAYVARGWLSGGKRAAATASAIDAAPADATAVAQNRADASVRATQPVDAAQRVATVADAAPARPADAATHIAHHPRPIHRPKRHVDAGPIQPTTRDLVLQVFPLKSEFSVNAGPWRPAAGRMTLAIDTGKVTVDLRNPLCCAPRTLRFELGTSQVKKSVQLAFLPGSIKPVCHVPGARVSVNDQPAQLGQSIVIPVPAGLGRQSVKVTFYTKDKVDTRSFVVRYRKTTEARCEL